MYVDAYDPSAVLFEFGLQYISLDGSFNQVKFVICHWFPCFPCTGLNNMETIFGQSRLRTRDAPNLF